MGFKSGAHPDCGGIDNCVSLQSPLNNKYDFYLQGGDSIYFSAGYSIYEGPTWRTVKITERPCPPPTGINVDSITLNSARLDFNNNQLMDIEFVGEEGSFTGVPNYPSVTNSLSLNNLTPQTGFKWQIRSNCLPQNISPWFNGTTFETGLICDSVPIISCDTVLNIHLKAGKSIDYQTTPSDPDNDRKIFFKYRPVRSDFLRMTVNQSQPYHSFEVAVRDSAEAVCTQGAWYSDHFFSGLPATIETKYLLVGHTYYVRLSHGTGNFSDTYVQLNLHCPDACPRPISLTNANIQQTKTTFQWQNNDLSDDYELEVRPLAESFTGTPNYSGAGNSRQVTGLQALHEYHWRVRNVCSGGMPGTWSDSLQFLTLPYCGGGPTISCNDTVTVSNGMGIDFLVGCGEGNGNERYFNFTPAYSGIYTIQITGAQYFGHFGFLIKPGNLDCSAANWTCLGIPYDVGYGVPTGFLQGGQTYNIAVNRPEYLNQYYNFKIDFAILCPPTCLPPNNLHVISTDHQSATLAWNQISADQSWEIEVVPEGQSFTGIPNYFSTSTSTVAGNLQPITNYQWRVRALCGAYGQSDWSASSTFRTAMDCGLYPPLQCGQSLDLFFPEGNGYYLNMGGCGSPLSGTEAVLTFTMDDNGGQRQLHFPQTADLSKFALFIKDLGASDCPGPANSWTCKANSPSNSVLLLNNLVQGHTYQVLIKKRASTGAVTLPLGFYCDGLPCDAPTDPYTQLSNTGGGTAKLFWTATSGPWHYEAAVHAVNGSYNAVNSNLNNGVNAFP